MNIELQNKHLPNALTSKKAWNAPKIEVIDIRQAQSKTGGLTDGFNAKSH